MIYVMKQSGDLVEATSRVPKADHGDIYRKAERENPEMVRAMFDKIKQSVTNREFMDGDKLPNSSWIGSQLLPDWDRLDEWNKVTSDSRELSNSLFGQIMWTVMFDDDTSWCTTRTPNANPAREGEERVYWLK